ncbi:hypothetical protein L484_026997 [Morus notabilis]|uniref:Uncharacterized protein n=1 Tax=Morus notabilis TaxID=981085 RepID=W9R153_9ROSA|nr:hypothetical protein L484_026997 [Morus notabilis]
MKQSLPPFLRSEVVVLLEESQISSSVSRSQLKLCATTRHDDDNWEWPVFEDIASNESTMAALSPAVLQASLNVTADFTKLFTSKIHKSSYILR